LPKTVTASVVLYHHYPPQVRGLFETLARDPALSEWVVVDNSGSDVACELAAELGARCIRPDRNVGFGSAHNLAVRSLTTPSRYHLIVNPDISLRQDTLMELTAIMDATPDAGVVMPRVLNSDGSVQHLCKLLPSPLDLVLRRFGSGPWSRLFQDRMNRYDMRTFDYSRAVYVPVLSGCFMFIRRSVLVDVGGFDERFFLYMEDVDLCRRIGSVARLLFWPWVEVTHGYAQGSYKSAHLLRLHIAAAIAYFNKWGWIYDRDRSARNSIGLLEAEIDCKVRGRAL
jgi:GT2 family glycosyltransferase